MRKAIKIIFLVFVFVFLVSNVLADDSTEIQEGRDLVLSKSSCSNLNNEQLESIGEYYMELMHSGQLHEIMDQRMGGEGSESLKLAHINIAKMMYCGEKNSMPTNMMNVMMNRGVGSYGMMGYFGNGYNMMSNYWGGSFFGGFTMIFWLVVIFLIIYILFRVLKGEDFSFRKTESSLDLLKRRYAKGEITKKEFEEIKKELK